MKKKIIAALLAFVLAAEPAAGPAGIETARAQEEQEQVTADGFYYGVDTAGGGGIAITGYDGSATEVVIPGEINGEKVTGIGLEAFLGCESMTSVSIPSSVTSIDVKAFKDCYNLASIEIPFGVRGISSYLFWNCGNLASVKIPESVTDIGTGAFTNCRSLTSIEIPSSVTSMEGEVFENCGLTSVSLPEGLKFIDYNTFISCSSLRSVNIPSSVTGISVNAFNGCGALKDVYYAGSRGQWDKINIMDGNESLKSATIHFGSSESSDSGSGAGTGTGTGTGAVQKKPQTITATDITKTYGAKAFSLGAKTSGNGTLSYAPSNPKVATVDAAGNVKITGCGITDIVITAKGTDTYSEAKKTIRLTVKPKKLSVTSLKSKKKKTVTVKWKRDKQASGYLIECATDKKFKKNKVKAEVKKNKTVTTTVKKLKGGKKYYVRICAYVRSGNTKAQGEWSKPKTVKVKK